MSICPLRILQFNCSENVSTCSHEEHTKYICIRIQHMKIRRREEIINEQLPSRVAPWMTIRLSLLNLSADLPLVLYLINSLKNYRI